MTQPNNNYAEDLNQIRQRFFEGLDEIDEIRNRYEGHELSEIDKIQSDAIEIVMRIDEIRGREASRTTQK